MKRSYIGLALGALIVVAAFVALPGCGFQRRLVAITINPPGANITGEGLVIDFQALGTYIHPPETVDITDSVVWTSAVPQVIAIVANTGVATSGFDCGTNITITATGYSNPQSKSGDVVVGTAAVNVTQPGNCQ